MRGRCEQQERCVGDIKLYVCACVCVFAFAVALTEPLCAEVVSKQQQCCFCLPQGLLSQEFSFFFFSFRWRKLVRWSAGNLSGEMCLAYGVRYLSLQEHFCSDTVWNQDVLAHYAEMNPKQDYDALVCIRWSKSTTTKRRFPALQRKLTHFPPRLSSQEIAAESWKFTYPSLADSLGLQLAAHRASQTLNLSQETKGLCISCFISLLHIPLLCVCVYDSGKMMKLFHKLAWTRAE